MTFKCREITLGWDQVSLNLVWDGASYPYFEHTQAPDRIKETCLGYSWFMFWKVIPPEDPFTVPIWSCSPNRTYVGLLGPNSTIKDPYRKGLPTAGLIEA